MRIDRLPEQAQFERGAAAGKAQQSLGTAEARNQAEVDFRLSQFRGVAGNPKVAGHGQFHATAQGKAIDHGDDGLAQPFDPSHQALPQAREVPGLYRRERGHLRDVRARHEGFRACTRQHHHPDACRVGRLAEGGVQFSQRGLVKRI